MATSYVPRWTERHHQPLQQMHHDDSSGRRTPLVSSMRPLSATSSAAATPLHHHHHRVSLPQAYHRNDDDNNDATATATASSSPSVIPMSYDTPVKWTVDAADRLLTASMFAKLVDDCDVRFGSDSNNTLQWSIQLRGNSLSSDSCLTLLLRLLTIPLLSHISLEWNTIIWNGLLSHAFIAAKSLRYIDARNCSLSHNNINDITTVIISSTSLLSLDLSWNTLGVRAGEPLLEAVRTNSTLRYLGLEGCGLNDEDVDAIEHEMKHHTHHMMHHNGKQDKRSTSAIPAVVLEQSFDDHTIGGVDYATNNGDTKRYAPPPRTSRDITLASSTLIVRDNDDTNDISSELWNARIDSITRQLDNERTLRLEAERAAHEAMDRCRRMNDDMQTFQKRCDQQLKVQADAAMQQSHSAVLALKLQVTSFARQLETERGQRITLMAQLESARSDTNRLHHELRVVQSECKSLIASVTEARTRAEDSVRDAHRNKAEIEREMERRLEAQRQLLAIAQNESLQHQQLLSSTSNQLVNARRSLADANVRLDDKKQRSNAVTIGDLEDRLAALQSSRAHHMASLASATIDDSNDNNNSSNNNNTNSRISPPLPSSLWASSTLPSVASTLSMNNNQRTSLPSSLPSSVSSPVPSSMSHESKYQAPAAAPATIPSVGAPVSVPASVAVSVPVATASSGRPVNDDMSNDERDNDEHNNDNDDNNDSYEQSASADEPPPVTITQPLRAPLSAPLSSLSMSRAAPLSSINSGSQPRPTGALPSLRAPLQPLSSSSTPSSQTSITVTSGSLSPRQVAAVAAAVAAASSYTSSPLQSSVTVSSSLARPNIPPASPMSDMPSEDDVEVEVDDDDDHEATASVSTGL